jgi:mycofactocin system creatininase family protein
LLVVPLGSTEQHGPHLPLATDTEIAVELCRLLAGRRPDVLVGPAVPYGSSGEHAGFPGTLSIGADALTLLLLELARSADVFAGVVFVCAHGGNSEPVARAVEMLRGEGRHVLSWFPRSADLGDVHAGRQETSAMLDIHPAAVHLERAEPGVRRPLPELMPALRAGGLAAVSPNGVLGDPTGSSAEEGRAMLDAWASDLAEAVQAWP